MTSIATLAAIGRLEEIRSVLTADLPEEFSPLALNVELILEEILVNVVNHAYQGAPGPFSASLSEVLFDGWPHLSLRIADWGPPFDPFASSSEPAGGLELESMPLGGLGLHLVKGIAAHHSYQRDRGANIIEVWLRRP